MNKIYKKIGSNSEEWQETRSGSMNRNDAIAQAVNMAEVEAEKIRKGGKKANVGCSFFDGKIVFSVVDAKHYFIIRFALDL